MAAKTNCLIEFDDSITKWANPTFFLRDLRVREAFSLLFPQVQPAPLPVST